jgi:Uri superfamily endonuclease
VKGPYAYVGSAQGGLEKRLQRHFRKSKRKFWHIDYLLDCESVKILAAFHKEARRTEECKVAHKISQTSLPVDGFGSSDCKCTSHLFKLKSYQILEKLMRETHMQSGSLAQ